MLHWLSFWSIYYVHVANIVSVLICFKCMMESTPCDVVSHVCLHVWQANDKRIIQHRDSLNGHWPPVYYDVIMRYLHWAFICLVVRNKSHFWQVDMTGSTSHDFLHSPLTQHYHMLRMNKRALV